MNKIEVRVIDGPHDPGTMLAFLARLTQRGHSISSMPDLMKLYSKEYSNSLIRSIAELPHGTIKRFTPITIAIVGASRRFLAQFRTHQVGLTYVSASLQYSDYTDKAQFVVPYELMEASKRDNINYMEEYLQECENAMDKYAAIAKLTSNDTAGYLAPQGLRNILVVQGNYQSWDYLIRTRGCNRNTTETQYVMLRIWEELLKTNYGEEFFGFSGPDCIQGRCREGKMSCSRGLADTPKKAENAGVTVPRFIIDNRWPLLKEMPK